MVYVLLDNKNIAYASVYKKPTADMIFLEMETEEQAISVLGKIWTGQEFVEALTEEEQEKLDFKAGIEYLICLQEINAGI